MSVPIWPATLPQELLTEGYSGELRGNILSTSMDAGPAKRRRRSTSGVKPVSGSQKLTTAELGYLAAFYETTLLDGSLRFKWKDPLVDDDITTTLIASLSGVTANLSLVDALAFISNPSTDLSDYAYTKVIVTDSAGKKAIGYIKSAGSGETLGDELVTNGGFDSDVTGWGPIDCSLASVAGGQSGNCLEITRAGGTSQNAYSAATITTVAGASYLASMYVKSGTSGNEACIMGLYPSTWSPVLIYLLDTSSASWTQKTGSGTATTNASRFLIKKNSSTAGTMLFDGASLKQRLTPSITGATITSTPGGTTYNWASIEAGFNYNDSYNIDIYATEMRFTEQPTWTAIEPGLFLVNYKLEILP